MKIFRYFDNQKINNSLVVMLTLFSLSLFLTACGEEKGPLKEGKVLQIVHVCEILKPSEVEPILGGAVAEPTKRENKTDSPQHWMSTCSYYSEKSQISVSVTVTPYNQNMTSLEAFEAHQASLKESLGNDYILESVDGIKDHAGWEKSTKQLTLFKEPFMVIINVAGPKLDSKHALELSKNLSQIFVQKLNR